MKSHGIWMVIGCALPLLLIFLLPLFGVSGGTLLFISLILCFGAHLLMMGHHEDLGNGDEEPKRGGGHHERH